jgi:hypothetical protein
MIVISFLAVALLGWLFPDAPQGSYDSLTAVFGVFMFFCVPAYAIISRWRNERPR